MRLFVYGTLKRSFRNNFLLNHARFVREDSIKGTLYTSSPHGSGIPFLLPGVGTVQGEVFEWTLKCEEYDPHLAQLDGLEGHPKWYTRELRKLDSGEEAWVYAYNHPEQIERLYLAPSGNFGSVR